MPITYTKLFHLLLDRGIKKGELQEQAYITASIMARLAKNETVRTDTIGKICKALNCQPGDIMDYEPDSPYDGFITDKVIQEAYDLYEIYHDEMSLDEFKPIFLQCVGRTNKLTGKQPIKTDKLNAMIRDFCDQKFKEDVQ